MLKKLIPFLLVLAVMLPAVSASVDLKITTPPDGAQYTFSGSLTVTVIVKNEGTNDSHGVNVSAEEEGLEIALPAPVGIPAGGDASSSLTISGQLCRTVSLTIEVSGLDPEGESSEDRITIELRPPVNDLKIIYPQQTLTLVDVEENSTKSFEVLVKNNKLETADSISLLAKSNSAKINCSVNAGAMSILGESTASYPVTCYHVSTGERVELQLMDSCKSLQDMESVTFAIVSGFKDYRLQILSPVENDQLRVSDLGGIVNVMIASIGKDNMTGVCAYAEGISFTRDNCINLTSKQNRTISLMMIPNNNLTNVGITVNDSTGTAHDHVTVWVTKIPIVQLANVTPVANQSGNNTSLSNTTTAEQKKESFEIPREILILIVLLVPIIILTVYIKKSLQSLKK